MRVAREHAALGLYACHTTAYVKAEAEPVGVVQRELYPAGFLMSVRIGDASNTRNAGRCASR